MLVLYFSTTLILYLYVLEKYNSETKTQQEKKKYLDQILLMQKSFLGSMGWLRFS